MEKRVEHRVGNSPTVKRLDIQKLVTLGLLSAIGIVLVLNIHIPVGTAFLEYDPADIPILIATILFGPLSGLAVTFVVCFIQAATVSAASQIYGFLMHMVATGTMVIVLGLIYPKGSKNMKRLALALVAGSAAMVLVMIPFNIVVTPIFMGAPREAVLGMLLPIIIPFNVIKAALNSGATFLLAKALEQSGVFGRQSR